MILNFAERSLTEGCNSKRLVSELSNVGTEEEIFLYFFIRDYLPRIFTYLYANFTVISETNYLNFSDILNNTNFQQSTKLLNKCLEHSYNKY